MKGLALINANSLHIPLADQSVHMVATSPPYFGLRDYGVLNQLGLEPLHDCLAWAKSEEPCGRCFVCNLRLVARELWRVLRDDGTLWLNLGDSYVGYKGANYGKTKGNLTARTPMAMADRFEVGTPQSTGMKQKDLMGVPWRVALALQADGWTLRSDVIWSKPNPMPESVTDRPTKAHEYVFLLSKRPKYYYDHEAVKMPIADSTIGRGPVDFGGAKGRKFKSSIERGEPNYRNGHEQWGKTFNYEESCATGRNRRSVWEITPTPYPGSHFATWPPDLVEPMIKASTSEAGACPACGRQWVRVVVKGEPVHVSGSKKVHPYGAESGHTNGMYVSTLHHARPVLNSNFTPACACDCDPVPAIVLDPFAGSGTTLMVARRLGRAGVGLDLSYAYLTEQARPRLQRDFLPTVDY